MLRESGVTNMYGAAPYIREEFNVGPDVSRRLLTKWMDTFSERSERTNSVDFWGNPVKGPSIDV